jgi:diguanylate cyclase (GGDEF)-like protein
MTLRQRDRAQLALREIAETDQLTSLPNRRGFDLAAKAAFAGRDPRHPLMSLLMIDIDFFKRINDGFGHDFGDAALVLVASLLQDLARSDALLVGRQGGEEFVALLPGRTESQACAIAERLREACARTAIEHGGRSALMTLSIGIASRQDWAGLAELMSEADRALYVAKQQGRNRVIAYRPATPRGLAA